MKNEQDNMWLQAHADMPSEWYRQRIEYLEDMLEERRVQTLRSTLMNRTSYITVCLENTFYPQNASALVRTCEAFGIQHIHTVQEICSFNPNTHIVRGTDKWVDLHSHRTTPEALNDLRRKGYRIVATSPHADRDYTPENFNVAAGPFALVFGTELEGISNEVRRQADCFIKIPMQGMVESLNLSASASILLYTLSQRVRKERHDWQMSDIEQLKTLWKWYMESVRDSVNIIHKKFNDSI